MTLEVMHWHKKLAPESGFKFMVPISGTSFSSMCQGPKIMQNCRNDFEAMID